MIYIKKREPSATIKRNLNNVRQSWEWKNTSTSDINALRKFFDNLTVKKDIRERLSVDQHGLCAYCMRKINHENSLRTKIEHFKPLSKDKDLVLDYNNYILVCDGGERVNISYGSNRILCCDSKKKEIEIVLNPLDHLQMEHIKYKCSGKIYYSDINDEVFADRRNYELNNVLGLNGELDENGNITTDTSTEIVKGRRDAYNSTVNFIQAIEKKYSRNSRKIKEIINDKIDELQSLDNYEEFIGVKLFVLKRKLKQLG